MKRIAVIDGDSICYLCSKDTLEESLYNVNSIISSIMEETGSNYYYLFLSEGPYFRHSINLEYKNKRIISPLKYLKTLKAYLKEEFGAVSYPNVEADDMVAYVMSITDSEPKASYISCAIDKDVINQVVGTHFNYKTHENIITKYEEARRFLYKQVLMGDSTDNIKGIPGVGEVKADKLLTNKTNYNSDVLKAYINYYKSAQAIFEFQKNFRQVYLLKNDEDFLREVNYIPELPELIKWTGEK